jgi:hypothetical protein
MLTPKWILDHIARRAVQDDARIIRLDTPAWRMTFAHFSVSLLRKAPQSTGMSPMNGIALS